MPSRTAPSAPRRARSPTHRAPDGQASSATLARVVDPVARRAELEKREHAQGQEQDPRQSRAVAHLEELECRAIDVQPVQPGGVRRAALRANEGHIERLEGGDARQHRVEEQGGLYHWNGAVTESSTPARSVERWRFL